MFRVVWTDVPKGIYGPVSTKRYEPDCPHPISATTYEYHQLKLSPLQFQVPRTAKSSSEEDGSADTDANSLLDSSSLLFSSIRGAVNLRDFHPPPMQAFMLWQTFLQNVNPLSKVIHAPLVQPQVIEASKDFDSVPKPATALLFAIYAAAVLSLKEEDCQAQLNGPKNVLLSRYFAACQQALAAASFMRSRNIVTLQAYVIFLV